MEAVHYCERFLELVIDLEALLPTRRFFNVVMDDCHLVTRCHLSALNQRTEGKLFGQVGVHVFLFTLIVRSFSVVPLLYGVFFCWNVMNVPFLTIAFIICVDLKWNIGAVVFHNFFLYFGIFFLVFISGEDVDLCIRLIGFLLLKKKKEITLNDEFTFHVASSNRRSGRSVFVFAQGLCSSFLRR